MARWMMRLIAIAVLMAGIVLSRFAGPAIGQDAALVEKGRALFVDTKLSGAGNISCAQCHPDNGHTDNKTYVGTAVVADGDPAGRSTPTLWGAGKRSVYSWAGTAPSLEANIRGIIVNRMKGAEPSPDTLAALGAYVRSLPPPRNVEVSEDGTPTEHASIAVQRGFELFVGDGGCGACHVLPTFDKAEIEDMGADGKFKVPALHAVSRTAPYFHDGRYQNLADVVEYMWKFQASRMGRPSRPTDAQVRDLIAYLNAL